jgi:hypothetical protein
MRDKIKMKWQGTDWIHLAHNRNNVQTFANKASIKCGNFLIKSKTFSKKTLLNGVSELVS